MLGQRVLTALVLLALLLPALWSDAGWPFAALTLLLLAAGGWEWARLNGWQGLPAYGLGVLVLLLGGVWWLTVPPAHALSEARPLLAAAAAAWVIGLPLALRAGAPGWQRLPQGVRIALGPVLLLAAWLAVVLARERGLLFILSVFVLVWAADIAAYFVGRAIGRRKLAPSISPGKSWEGAIGGWLAALLLSFGMAWGAERWAGGAATLAGELMARHGLALALLVLTALVALSVAGDLFESLIKRAAGQKDSSQLLPGHGGVLDRCDALLPVFPVALALLA